MPSSAIDTGAVVMAFEYQSRVVTSRTPSTVKRSVDPVTGSGRSTRTGTVAFSWWRPSTIGASSMAGMSTVPTRSPSTSMPSWVGTEWRPSATICRSRWSTVSGSGTSYST